jgi:hypothetical protein
VTTAGELNSALAGGSARDIVLADGTYDASGYFHPAAPHRLWAEHLGGATLRAGILFDKGEGAELHGIRFSVSSQSKGYEGAIIHNGRTGNRLKVMDSWLMGNNAMKAGILARTVHGLTFQRLVIKDLHEDGIKITSYPTRVTPSPPIYLADLDIANIVHPDPKCCSGTAEDGILITNTGPSTIIERIKVRNAQWMCLTTSLYVDGGVMRDVDIDGCETGLYTEHTTHNLKFSRFKIGSNVQEGIAFEGGNEASHYSGSSENIVIEDGVNAAFRAGVNISVCNKNETVQRVKFVGQCFAAISNWATHPFGSCTGSEGATNKFLNNDYSQVDPGAEQVSLKWAGSTSCR